MAESVHLAVDLGASGGRIVAGLFDGTKIRLEEVARFPNGGVTMQNSLHWNLLGLWGHVLEGLRTSQAKYGTGVKSIGVDTWGVDYGLLGRGGELLGNPHHYRDRRTEGIMPKLFQKVSRKEVFAATGLQFMPFNTLYQLYAAKLQNAASLEHAERLLMMPDLFHWLLTGIATNERTNASTTQCYDPQKKTWAAGLLEQLGLPTSIFGPLIDPGTPIGPLLPSVASETGLKDVLVVAPGTHDTASAVLAVPAMNVEGKPPKWCYISSGTWALMGVDWPQPIINEKVLQLNYTNEGGVGGTSRVLKNITGLWLMQECQRIWSREGHHYSWEDLTRQADGATPLLSFVDPDHPDFTAPADMPAAIRHYCQRTSQPTPESHGQVVRCVLESIALKSRYVLGGLETLTGETLETVHIVGGGVQNHLLCQMISSSCIRPVLAGPVEATAIGNVMVQLMAAGAVGNIAQARQIIRQSFPLVEFQPRDMGAWDDAFDRFLELLQPASA